MSVVSPVGACKRFHKTPLFTMHLSLCLWFIWSDWPDNLYLQYMMQRMFLLEVSSHLIMDQTTTLKCSCVSNACLSLSGRRYEIQELSLEKMSQLVPDHQNPKNSIIWQDPESSWNFLFVALIFLTRPSIVLFVSCLLLFCNYIDAEIER